VKHWLSNPPDEDPEPVRRHIRANKYLLSHDFALQLLEPAGLLDDAYNHGVLYGRESRRRVGERELREEAACLEKAGSFDRAALRHLWLEDREEASRLVEKVPINDDNLYCNQSAGRWREVVEYLARMERPLDAARIALGANDLGVYPGTVTS